jgi:hypothetical protein
VFVAYRPLSDVYDGIRGGGSFTDDSTPSWGAALTGKSGRKTPDACDMDAFQALTCTPYYGNVGLSSPTKCSASLHIDLAKRVIQYLTGVATGSNA